MQKTSLLKRLTQWGAIGAVAASAFAMQAPAVAADNWPSQPVNFIVGFGTGGSADRMARLLSQYMSPELGQPIVVVNRPGAGGQLAATQMLAQGDDGHTILATAISPYLANTIVHTGANYDIDDFAFVNGQWFDYDLVAIHKDRPFQDLPSFLESVKANPGKHSVSVVPNSSGHITTYLLLEAAGIPAENLNVVTYESGGQARSAVAGGQVDLTIISAEGSEGIRDMIRPLAIVRDEALESWDAPAVNDALKPMGIELPLLNGSIRGIATSAKFKEKYPERFDKLTQAYEKALQNQEFRDQLQKLNIGAEWVGPESITQTVQRNYDIIKKYKDLIEK